MGLGFASGKMVTADTPHLAVASSTMDHRLATNPDMVT